jgi:PAS domain S-box-containing protein
MIPAPRPQDEQQRVRALRRLAVLDGTPHRDLDDAVALTSEVLGLPAALTLLDEEHQWQIARAGVDASVTSRAQAFCSYTILVEDVMVVPDAVLDPRFTDLPPVEGMAVRAYAGVPLRSASGHAVGALCVTDTAPRDFTAHELTVLRLLARQVQRLLQAREMALQHAAASLAGEFASFQIDGQGELLFASRGLVLMAGADGKERLAGAITELFPELTHDDLLGPPTRRQLPRRTQTTLLRRRDGTTVTVELTTRPLLGASGTLLGALGLVRDVTEQRRQEVEERHAQKLEALGRLSAGLAHEINTPIQFVGDNTRFLSDAYAAMVNLVGVYRQTLTGDGGSMPWAERRSLLERAESDADVDFLTSEVPLAVEQSLEGIERVASLVRAMKEFSYKDRSEHAPTDLNQLLQTTITVTRHEFKYTADIELDLADLPPVTCSRSDLGQVFLNLLINAADAIGATGRHGRITVTTRVLPQGDRIADDGPGIPAHLREKVFEPFFTTKDVGKGTGQGLSLARSVIDGHGGTLTLDCPAAGGTVFTITLAATPAATDAPAPEQVLS